MQGQPPRASGPGPAIAAAVISLVILAGLGFLAWSYFFASRDDTTTTPAPTPPPAFTPAPLPSPTPEPTDNTVEPSPEEETSAASADPEPVVTEYVTVDVQDAARAELELVREDSLAYVALDGRWVAVLSTKKSGTTDPTQIAKNGSHTFYEDDILALHEDLALYFYDEAQVLLVRSSDFGKQPRNGDVFWRSIADAGFSSKEDVSMWCTERYPGTEKEIENSCLPKQLVPPTQS